MHSLSNVGYTVGGGPFSSHCSPSKLSFNPQLHPPYATMPSSISNWIPANNQYTWRDSNNQGPPPHPSIQRNQMRSSNGSDWRRQMTESSHFASTTGPPGSQCMWSQPQPQSLIQSQPFTANTRHWNEQNYDQQGTHGPIDSSNMHALNQYFSIRQQPAGCHVKFDGQGDEPIVYSAGQQRAKGSASNQKSLQQHQTTFPDTSRSPQVSVSAMGVENAPETQYSYTSATTEAPKLLPPVPTMNRNSPKPCGTCPACTFQTKSSRMPGQPHLVRSPKVQQKIQPTQGHCTMPQMITSSQVQPQSPAQSGDMQMLNFANLLPMQVQQSHQ